MKKNIPLIFLFSFLFSGCNHLPSSISKLNRISITEDSNTVSQIFETLGKLAKTIENLDKKNDKKEDPKDKDQPNDKKVEKDTLNYVLTNPFSEQIKIENVTCIKSSGSTTCHIEFMATNTTNKNIEFWKGNSYAIDENGLKYSFSDNTKVTLPKDVKVKIILSNFKGIPVDLKKFTFLSINTKITGFTWEPVEIKNLTFTNK